MGRSTSGNRMRSSVRWRSSRSHITKTRSAHSRSSRSTARVANRATPAERTSYRSSSRYRSSAVRLRSTLAVQTKRTRSLASVILLTAILEEAARPPASGTIAAAAAMNTERLLRDIERRLSGLGARTRAEVMDAVREEIARERRRQAPPSSVEVERERRAEAEALREVLEAINRQASLSETVDEVLKQLSRIVRFDSCSVALRDPDGQFRIIAGRGFPDPARIIGTTFRDTLSDELSASIVPVSLADVREDPRFVPVEGSEPIRSWAGIPLVVEGDTIGLLCLDRHRVEPFEEEDIHRAKAVAFSAAAAIRKAHLHEKVRRFATLMERVVQVDHAVFAGRNAEHVSRLILDGALKVGTYEGGLLVLDRGGSIVVAAASSALGIGVGSVAAKALAARATRRVPADQVKAVCRGGSFTLPEVPLYLVPVATPEVYLGTLVLQDAGGETPDDRVMDAYASRAAVAWFHSLRPGLPA